MGWWPFQTKSKSIHSEPHLKNSKLWIQELREVCERCFDDREDGQLEVKKIQSSWQSAHSKGEVEESLLNGLEKRADMLLKSNDSEWVMLLDNEDFWKVGWGREMGD